VGTLEVIDTAANVKKLIGHQYDYRLRVGDYRIFFNHAALIEIVFIEEIKKRDERTY
jgi:mRNA-degrading endonuclease RelE of RelBE toxin-antitoxin system